MQRPSRAERWSSRALSLAKAAARVVPKRVREGAWDRFFGAVFEATRVTNDAYPQPEGAVPEPGSKGDPRPPRTSQRRPKADDANQG